MTNIVSVGRFATMTHLSVKTLRHYHQVGLLEPAEIDAQTGYRYYALEQLPTAQLIRRLRDLRMPVPDVRAVLVAEDPVVRDGLISAHIDHLEAELAKTRAAVHSLRTLLAKPADAQPVRRRTDPMFPVLAITEETLDPADIEVRWRGALAELRSAADDHGWAVTGPAGGLYDECLFQQEPGTATVFIPVATPRASGRATPLVIPASEVVVTMHHGTYADVDLAYSRLGSFVAEHELTVSWQLREYYLHDHSHTSDDTQWRTEVAWPIIDSPAD